MRRVDVMGSMVLAGLVVGASLIACPPLAIAGEAAERPPGVGVRLLSLRVFWVDPPGRGAPESAGAAGETLDRRETFAAEGTLGLEALTGGDGKARLLRPASAVPSPVVIGTRTGSRHGTVHTLNATRLATLDDSARETVRDLIGLRAMERRAYWEAAFELAGLRRDEVDWMEAVGPGLIKPSRAWATFLREAVDQPAAGPGPVGRSCLGLGPLSLCLNLSRTILSIAGGNHPRERSRVRLTRSLWDGGTSCGAVVTGRLLDYSTVTFRVRTNGRGPRRAGVTYFPPFDLNGALGRARGAEAVDPEPR